MTQKLKSLFRSSIDLRPLLGQLGYLERLQSAFRQLAPASLASASHVVALESGCLTLLADNAAIAAKLRQLGPSLAGDLSERGLAVDRVRVRVGVRNIPPPRISHPQHLGSKARQEVHQLAESLDESPLKAALTKLLAQSR